MKLPIALQPGETLITTCRRHPLFIWPKLIGMALAAIVPPILLIYIVNRTNGLDGVAGQATYAVAAIWFLFWAVRTYFVWYRHQNDLWIITNQRLVDSIKKHWFSHVIASADLVNVVDISTVRTGLLPTAFNFGNVRCETAGERSLFILAGIPKPADVLGIIDRARDDARRESLVAPGVPAPNQGVTRL